jgi:ankyrin repeat protein
MPIFILLFIEAGVDVDAVQMFRPEREFDYDNSKYSADDFHTPLHKAAFYGHTEVVRVLIKAGASLSVRTTEGNTPLDLAANEECRKLLQGQRSP